MSIVTLLGDAVRRNPYPLYTALRRLRPVLRDRTHDYWILFATAHEAPSARDAHVRTACDRRR